MATKDIAGGSGRYPIVPTEQPPVDPRELGPIADHNKSSASRSVGMRETDAGGTYNRPGWGSGSKSRE